MIKPQNITLMAILIASPAYIITRAPQPQQRNTVSMTNPAGKSRSFFSNPFSLKTTPNKTGTQQSKLQNQAVTDMEYQDLSAPSKATNTQNFLNLFKPKEQIKKNAQQAEAREDQEFNDMLDNEINDTPPPPTVSIFTAIQQSAQATISRISNYISGSRVKQPVSQSEPTHQTQTSNSIQMPLSQNQSTTSMRAINTPQSISNDPRTDNYVSPEVQELGKNFKLSPAEQIHITRSKQNIPDLERLLSASQAQRLTNQQSTKNRLSNYISRKTSGSRVKQIATQSNSTLHINPLLVTPEKIVPTSISNDPEANNYANPEAQRLGKKFNLSPAEQIKITLYEKDFVRLEKYLSQSEARKAAHQQQK